MTEVASEAHIVAIAEAIVSAAAIFSMPKEWNMLDRPMVILLCNEFPIFIYSYPIEIRQQVVELMNGIRELRRCRFWLHAKARQVAFRFQAFAMFGRINTGRQ